MTDLASRRLERMQSSFLVKNIFTEAISSVHVVNAYERAVAIWRPPVYKMDAVSLFCVSWLNIRIKCCKACGKGTQERYCLI